MKTTWKCQDCGAIIFYPERVERKEWHEEVCCYERMTFLCCPDCGSEEIEEYDEEDL